MKTTVLTVALLLLCSLAVKADPAKKVTLTYKNDSLTVEAAHNVNDVTTHYISQLIVKSDGKEIKTLLFKKQSSKSAQVVVLYLPGIKSGTTLEAEATCNVFGKKSGQLVVK